MDQIKSLQKPQIQKLLLTNMKKKQGTQYFLQFLSSWVQNNKQSK